LKIDVILPQPTEFAQLEQPRAIRLSAPDGLSVILATPEDVILNKLVFFPLEGSEQHLRDMGGILKVKAATVDRGYITTWATKLGVGEEWALVPQRVDQASS
jgi:hypothetical protein